MNIYGCPTPWQNSQPQYQEPGCPGWGPVERTPPDRQQLPGPCFSPPPPAPQVCLSPWTSVGLPWGSDQQQSMMQFTAHSPFVPTSAPLHCKRKSNMEAVVPAKQFISEEKMAAHMSGLHISPEYTEYGMDDSQHNSTPHTETQIDMREWLKGGKKIVLADEIKRIQQEPLLPAALIERLEKPCMSLMVWKPKEDAAKSKDDSDCEESGETSTRRHRTGVLVEPATEDSGMDVEM